MSEIIEYKKTDNIIDDAKHIIETARTFAREWYNFKITQSHGFCARYADRFKDMQFKFEAKIPA